MNAPETLQTERLVGRRIGPSDLSYLVETDSDPRVAETLFGVQTLDQSRARLGRWLQLWEDQGFGFWIFRDAAERELGHAGLFYSPHDSSSVEVGYVLKPNYWNRGYATEIAMAILKVGFKDLCLPRIIAVAQPGNLASRRVMEKSGLLFEDEFLYKEQLSVRYAIDRGAWLRAHAV